MAPDTQDEGLDLEQDPDVQDGAQDDDQGQDDGGSGDDGEQVQTDSASRGDEGQGRSGNRQDADSKAADDYFLSVNARTRYKTKDDALKAYRDAGDRIRQLSPYADILERNGISDPSVLEGVLQEFLRLRKQVEDGQGRGGSNSDSSSSKAAAQSAYDGMNDKDKANVEYLTKIGFKPTEAVEKVLTNKIDELSKKFDERFAALDASSRTLNEKQQQVTVEQGQTYLSQLLDEKGIQANEKTLEFLEQAITQWVTSGSYDRNGRVIAGSLVDRFSRGGRELQEVVAEGLERALEAINSMSLQKDAKFQNSKRQNITRAGKVPPKGSAHHVEGKDDKSGKDGKPARRPGSGGIFQDPSIHEKAFELMNSTRRES